MALLRLPFCHSYRVLGHHGNEYYKVCEYTLQVCTSLGNAEFSWRCVEEEWKKPLLSDLTAEDEHCLCSYTPC